MDEREPAPEVVAMTTKTGAGSIRTEMFREGRPPGRDAGLAQELSRRGVVDEMGGPVARHQS
jgi:hypothetical protein